MRKIFKTSEEITKAFIKDGWSKNIKFTEVTEEEAEENGNTSMLSRMAKGRKFFRMNVCGNVYDDHGKIYYFNI